MCERDEQIVARVVAWHNRHPLATRIKADHVHSVGVVSLPFAVQGAQVQAWAETTPTGEPEPAAPTAEAAAAVAAPAGEASVGPAAEAPGESPGGAPGEAPAESLGKAPAEASAQPPADPQAEAPAAAPAEPPPVPEPPPAPARMRWQVSGLPPRRPRWHPLAWLERLRGGGAYRALFSEDFIEPLRVPRVARWAAAHGVADWPLPAGAAQRLVMLDPALRRAGDGAAELDLHVITAAIGIGDQRHRLLLAPGAGGAVLGRRHWSRQRALSALPLLAGVLIAAGAAWQLRGAGTAPDEAAKLLAAASAPAASQAAAAASEPTPVSAPEPADEAASAPAPTRATDTAAAEAPAAESEPKPKPKPEPELVASAPPAADARAGSVDLPPLRPRLDDQQRRELRAAGRALRQEPAATKAWALVTPLLRDRRQSERVAAQLHAVALLQPVPMQTELVPAGNGWRAVFWPFDSEQDAQKVRLALADKGLPTELLEF